MLFAMGLEVVSALAPHLERAGAAVFYLVVTPSLAH